MLDQEEDALFDNDHMKALIKRIYYQYEYLVNPIFDLDEIVKQKLSPEIERKYEASNSLTGDYNRMN